MNGGSLSHSDWHNLHETVFQEHRGEKEYTDKLEEQITLFQGKRIFYNMRLNVLTSKF